MSTLRDSLNVYLAQSRGIRSARKLRHQVNRWEKYSSITLPITTKNVEAFRSSCLQAGLSNSTIETTISDVFTILRMAKQPVPEVGRRLPLPKGNGFKQPSLETVAKVYAVADQANWPNRTKLRSGRFRPWCQEERTALFRGLLFLKIWTAFRLGDLTSLTWDNIHEDRIEKSASKTSRLHLFPIVADVKRHLEMIRGLDPETLLPIKTGSRRFVRAELKRLCRIAKVEPFTMKMLRPAGITEWASTGTDAGRVAHGIGLGVLDSYYSGLKILQRAAHRFSIPPEMRDPDQRREVEQFIAMLVDIARRMQVDQIAMLTRMAEAM